MSSFFVVTIIATILSKIRLTETVKHSHKKFWLLVLDSLKYNSKAESHINRCAKAVISRSLTISRHIYLFFLILYYDLNLFLNLVASNGFEVAPFWKISPTQCERACGGPDYTVWYEHTLIQNIYLNSGLKLKDFISI